MNHSIRRLEHYCALTSTRHVLILGMVVHAAFITLCILCYNTKHWRRKIGKEGAWAYFGITASGAWL